MQYTKGNKGNIKCNSVCMIGLFLLDLCLHASIFFKYLHVFEYRSSGYR